MVTTKRSREFSSNTTYSELLINTLHPTRLLSETLPLWLSWAPKLLHPPPTLYIPVPWRHCTPTSFMLNPMGTHRMSPLL
jgi:hypothetical protein